MAKPVEILGIKIDPLTHAEFIEKLKHLFRKRGKSQIATVNSEFIETAQVNPDFKDVINSSSLRLADGIGILIASKFNSLPLTDIPVLRTLQAIYQMKICLISPLFYPKYIKSVIRERLAGADVVYDIIKLSLDNNYKIFLLGALPGVADKASLILQTDNYGLRVVGTYAGSPNIEEEDKIVSLINKHKADIIFVAFGAPKQDLWIARNLKKTTAKLAVGVGGTFDFIAGNAKRAPLWIQNHGLEWLYRLVAQPSRLKRQIALPKFLWSVCVNKIKQR